MHASSPPRPTFITAGSVRHVVWPTRLTRCGHGSFDSSTGFIRSGSATSFAAGLTGLAASSAARDCFASSAPSAAVIGSAAAVVYERCGDSASVLLALSVRSKSNRHRPNRANRRRGKERWPQERSAAEESSAGLPTGCRGGVHAAILPIQPRAGAYTAPRFSVGKRNSTNSR